LLFATRLMPVLSLTAVTVAFVMTAPVGSATLPLIEPVMMPWPYMEEAPMAKNNINMSVDSGERPHADFNEKVLELRSDIKSISLTGTWNCGTKQSKKNAEYGNWGEHVQFACQIGILGRK
jgi:hypothetical protein